MISNEQKDIASWAMKFALNNGCESSRVSITTGNSSSFEYRDMQLDKLHQSSENKLYIELFVDGRYGSLSTNRLDKTELEDFIKGGIESTRFLAQDTCRQLPSAEKYYKPSKTDDLDLFDSSFFEHTAEAKLDMVQSVLEEVRGIDNRIVSVVASYDDGCGAEYMIASNGFEHEEKDTAYSLSAEISLKAEGDARPEAYWYDSKVYWSDLVKTGIASQALDKALQKLNQRKIKSGSYPMLLDNMVSSRMLSPLISAMYGSAIQQKNTFLLDKLNQRITSPLLTITDSPHQLRTFGSRWYDGEGVATEERVIIENGVLNTYFIDTYNALKLNMSPTIGSPSVLRLNLGTKNRCQLMSDLRTGVWVTGFNGGNTNGTTGDFSFGIEGFLIENGVAVLPIGEMNITGNMLNLWNNLVAIGNDPFLSSSSRQIPSLLFDNVSFSGL